MISTLEVPEAGLTVMRGRIEPDVIDAYADECEKLFMTSFDEIRVTRGMNSPGVVSTLTVPRPEASIPADSYPAMREVLAMLELGRKTLAINLQDPFSSQKFHTDLYKNIPVTVIHAQGKGAFDYAPTTRHAEIAEQVHETVELGAGDVVLQSLPYIMHRGRNAGIDPRITTVSY